MKWRRFEGHLFGGTGMWIRWGMIQSRAFFRTCKMDLFEKRVRAF